MLACHASCISLLILPYLVFLHLSLSLSLLVHSFPEPTSALAFHPFPTHHHLHQVANWADQVRSQPDYKWSAPLHFIDTPDWECAYTPATDCVDSKCVAGAIGNYSKRVVSMDGDTADEAAKFITHFCGDIHQPLQLRPQRRFLSSTLRELFADVLLASPHTHI
jgi:hypothetical protein